MFSKSKQKIENTKYRLVLNRLLVFISMLVFLVSPMPIHAASLTSVSDTMSRLYKNTAADHDIKFTLPNNTWAASETTAITFDSAGKLFDLSTLSNTDPLDYDIKWGATEKTVVAAGSCAANSIEITSINTSTDVITFTLCPGSTASSATENIEIKIGLNATSGGAGNSQITNPNQGADTNYYLDITAAGGDTARLAIIILSTQSDQIPVQASVNPTISLTVANTTLDLSTLDSSAISTTSFNNITIGTNGNKGYTITVHDTNAGLLNSAASKTITSATGTLATGAEGYGGNCNKLSGSGSCSFVDGATQNVTGFTTSGATFASYNSKPSSPEQFQIRVKASISTTTDAGSYTDTLIVIGTANY